MGTPADLVAALQGAAGGAPTSAGSPDPTTGPQPGMGPGQPPPGADPSQAPVSSVFPSLDPQALQQIVGQVNLNGSDGLAQLLQTILPMQQQDEQTLAQMQLQQIIAVLQSLMQPDQSGALPPGATPEVGGSSSGY